jgi:hypothetical protein
MDRSQRTGLMLMGGGVLQMLLFLAGVSRKSYAALALPLLGAISVISGLAFWIGWTMFTTEPDLGEEEEELPPPAPPAGE